MTRSIINDDRRKPNNAKDKMSSSLISEFESELRESEELLLRLSNEEIVVSDRPSSEDRIEEVYINRENLNRKDAEAMLLFYLSKYGYNVDNIKFKWVKPKYLVHAA